MITENASNAEVESIEIVKEVIENVKQNKSPLIHLGYINKRIFLGFSTARIDTEKVQELMDSSLNLMNEIISQLAEKGIGAEQSKIIRISKRQEPDFGVVEKSKPTNQTVLPINPHYDIRNVSTEPNRWIEYEIIVKLGNPF